MPTNANTFNSRVTSEALEAKFREVFPSQGGAELPQDLFASGVLQPVVDFSSVAEGSVLPQLLQISWDFSTGLQQINGSTPVTIINNTGFWLVDLSTGVYSRGNPQQIITIEINDGSTQKPVWEYRSAFGDSQNSAVAEGKFVVFLRAGDTLQGKSSTTYDIPVWYRQIADVNGNLTNPLGFSFS